MTTPAEKSRCPQCGTKLPANAPQGLCPNCLLGQVDAATEGGERSVRSTGSEAPSLEDLATAFPQLEIIELIGQGGMGLVYKARQSQLDRFVALKVLPQRLAEHPGFRERFTREGRMLARLSHSNIVNVFDFGEAGGFFYLLMEFVDGVNLRQAMRAGRFTLAQALTVVPKICEALSYAHAEGVLHRDIKPENILLDTRGRVKIADFGIAKLLGELDRNLTATDAHLGTPHYMAPEQLEHPSEVDHRADIYSLGVVFYEMLTGELPLGQFRPPSEKSPHDPRVDEVVMRALARERERRQQSANEVRTQVETISSTPLGAAADKSEPKRKTGEMATAWSWMSIAAAVIAVPAWIAAFVGVGLVVPWVLAQRGGGIPQWGALIMMPVVLLPPLLASALGWLALREPGVRSGTQRGSWLATFALMTFPAILLQLLLLLVAQRLLHTPLGLLTALFAIPVGFAAALIAGAKLHRKITARSAAPWPRRFAWAFAAVYAVLVLPFAGTGLYLRAGAKAPAVVSSGGLEQGGIELVAIAPHPSTGESWWRPDGAPATEGPFLNDGSTVHPQAGEQAFEFVFRTKDLPPGASLPTWQFQPPANWAGTGNPELGTKAREALPNHHLVAASLPLKAQTATISAGIAAGPWETKATCETRGHLSTSRSEDGIDWAIAFGEPVETREGSVVLHVSHPRLPDWQMRVIAINAQGQEIPSSRTSSSGAQITARFPDVSLTQVKEFRFQARRYHWVEFRNIALAPGGATTPTP